MRTASILIRTKDEERSLAATLDGVVGQRVAPHEIIVIDSGSKDDTLGIAARYPVRILHIPPDQWGYSRALNLGARHATGEILVCLSAHCIPAGPGWLESLLCHFDDLRVAAVWGPDPPPGSPIRSAQGPERHEPGTYDLDSRERGFTSANGALRRSLWLEFPFDESMPATEDKAWGREALARGYCLVRDPAAAVWHEAHSLRNAARRNRMVAAGYAMMFPELNASGRSVVMGRAARVWRRMSSRARRRDVRGIWLEIRRFPSAVAAMVGDLVGSRARH